MTEISIQDAFISVQDSAVEQEVLDGDTIQFIQGVGGIQGATGYGVPTGGTDGQYLRKVGGVNYVTSWTTLQALDISDFTEATQDAIGGSLLNTATIDLTYNDPTGQLSADVNDASLAITKLSFDPYADIFTVNSQVSMLALAAKKGDIANRTDIKAVFILSADDPTVLGNWVQLQDAVLSVNGQTGTVVLAPGDVGADPAGSAAAAQAAAQAYAAGLVDDLSGVTNAATARTNLGLGSAATHNHSEYDLAGAAATAQSAAQSYAAGLVDDLSGVTDSSTARTNLGLGSAATHAAGDFDTVGSAAAAQSAAQSYALGLVDDLSGVSNAATARTNLGLGTAATANTGDFDAVGTAAAAVSAHVAAIDPHGDRAYALGLVDDLSGVSNASQARTNLGLGTAATQNTSAFDAAGSAAAAQSAAQSYADGLVDDLSGVSDASTARTNLGLGTVATLAYDTDVTLAANSDSRVATQKAVKAYADSLITTANAVVYKGTINCSTNPNYPAADSGDLYIVSVAGKIGGGSGIDVEVGDLLLCNTDGTVSGNQATVGTYWNIIEKNIVGAVTGPASSTNGNVAVFSGTTGKVIADGGTLGTAAFTASTAYDVAGAAAAAQSAAQSYADALVDDLSGVTNAATARTNLGLGSAATQNTSAFDAAGTAASAIAGHIAAVDPHGDRSYAAGLVDDLSGVTDAATARTNLGLGSAATAASTDFVAVIGDTMTGNLIYSNASGDVTMGSLSGDIGIGIGPQSGAPDVKFVRTGIGTAAIVGSLTSSLNLSATSVHLVDTNADTQLYADGLTVSMPAAASYKWLYLKRTGEINYRLTIDKDGLLEWGDGSVTDTNLYRSAADTLKTDDTFDAATLKQAGTAITAIMDTKDNNVKAFAVAMAVAL